MTTDESAFIPAPAPRFRIHEQAPEFLRAMVQLDQTAAAGLEPTLLELIRMRASLINGCAFCLDMHSTDARKNGEQEHRLYSLAAWRETPWFTARERAALALTEEVTLIADGHVPDEVYEEAARHFDDKELAQVIAVIVTINAWNRIAVASKSSPAPRQA